MSRMRTGLVRGIVCTATILFCTSALWGVEFAGGTGEPNDPYQIATAAQLIRLGSDPNLFDKHFVLTADIDLDPNLPGGGFFREAVIGLAKSAMGRRGDKLYYQFEGSFDGAGHVIRNCTIYSQRYGLNAALFHSVGSQGRLRRVHLEDVMIVGGAVDFTGSCTALAGENAGMIVDCSSTGVILAGSRPNGGGGLVGSNWGTLVRCRSSCHVSGNGAGGLAASNGGRIEFCSSDGVVASFTPNTSAAGGLVGYNSGVVRYCFSDGYVLAENAGGLVGENTGTAQECYNLAPMLARPSGGIAGRSSGMILNCYSLGSVSGDGLVLINTGTIACSYSTTPSLVRPASTGTRWAVGESVSAGRDVAVSAAAQKIVQSVYYLHPDKTADQPIDLLSGYGIALSPSEMTQASSFVGFDFHGDANDGPAGHWFMPPEGYPVLTWQTEITGLTAVPGVSGLTCEQATSLLEFIGIPIGGIRYDYARPKRSLYGGTPQDIDIEGQAIFVRPVGYGHPGDPAAIVVSLGEYDFDENPGDGSEENPYQIETPGQLDAASYKNRELRDKHFELTADIDLSGCVYPTSLLAGLSGGFSGNGYVIRNLQAGAGLFGVIDSSAVVRDLVVENAWINSLLEDRISVQVGSLTTLSGILAGANYGQVSRCRVTGQVVGGSFSAGGLVGENRGQLTDCASSGRIRPSGSSWYVGGLAGMNTGTIRRCCAHDVEVLGGEWVGGLVGESLSSQALIESCYATGTVRGGASAGGLIGQLGTLPRTLRRSAPEQEGIVIAADPLSYVVIRDCYAACVVTGFYDVGGCIGSAASELRQKSCFFLVPEDGAGPDNELGMSLTDSQMKQQASFGDWDFENVWTICEGRDYPRLRWEGAVCDAGP